jgi:arylsulfatase A-like enzyme
MQTKQLENTVIIFTSDHGLSCGQHGLMGKQNMFEHSMKPPLIISGPNFPKGKIISSPVYMQDIMPTTLELANIPIPDDVAFKSLIPVIKGKESYSSIYGAYKDKQRMIRKDNFKLVWYPDSETYLMFDLNEDPYEMNNLMDKKNKKPIFEELKRELYNQQLKLNDPMLTGNYGNLKE